MKRDKTELKYQDKGLIDFFGRNMKITENPDTEITKAVKEGLRKKGGYCPCRIERTPDTKCMCKEFRDQIKDPEFEGFCHCMLYYKSK